MEEWEKAICLCGVVHILSENFRFFPYIDRAIYTCSKTQIYVFRVVRGVDRALCFSHGHHPTYEKNVRSTVEPPTICRRKTPGKRREIWRNFWESIFMKICGMPIDHKNILLLACASQLNWRSGSIYIKVTGGKSKSLKHVKYWRNRETSKSPRLRKTKLPILHKNASRIWSPCPKIRQGIC